MRVAIIGGAGKMGRWFASFLLHEGKEVIITGRNEQKLAEVKQQLGVDVATSLAAVEGSDAIIISVPVDAFEDVAKQLQPHTRPEQVIMDVTSVKVLPVEIMHRHLETASVLGTHPVFGPGAKDMVNQNFVLTPTNEKETALAQNIRWYLESHGARVTLMTPQAHDKMMSVILGLSHFIAIVAADTLLSFDNLPQMKAISGTTYKLLLTLVESVLSEDPGLYASLQMNLPGITETEERFLQSSRTWVDIVKNQDRQRFVNRMKSLKEMMIKSDPDFGQAYENMYRLLSE